MLAAGIALVIWAGAAASAEFPAPSRTEAPVDLSCDLLEYQDEGQVYVASGSVLIRQGERSLSADWMAFSGATRRGIASGNVVFKDGDDTLYAEFIEFDVSTLEGTGAGGKITKEDVERALSNEEEKKEALIPTQARTTPFTGMRKSIAVNMHKSLQDTAQLTIFTEVDVTEMVRFRDRVRKEYRKDESVRVSASGGRVLGTEIQTVRAAEPVEERVRQITQRLETIAREAILPPVVEKLVERDLLLEKRMRHLEEMVMKTLELLSSQLSELESKAC